MASKFFKKFGRKTAKANVIVNRFATPALAGVAGYFLGAPAAAAVDYGGSRLGGYFRATQARNEGVRGLPSRQLGHAEFRRDLIYGAIGGGAGVVGSGLTTAFMGGTLGQSLSSGLFGQYGSTLLGNQGSIFNMGTAHDFGAGPHIVTDLTKEAPGAPLKNIVTSLTDTSPAASGSTSTVASTAGGAGASSASKLLDVFGKPLLGALAGQPTSKNTPIGTKGSQGNVFGGGGGGGDDGGGTFGLNAGRGGAGGSDGLMPLLLIGGALLFMSVA